jgi:hypothetical protein
MLSFVMRRMFLCIFFENLFNIGSVAGCVDKQQNTTDNLLEELRYLKEKEFILYLTMLTIPSLQSMLEYYIECSLHKMLFQYFRGAVAKKKYIFVELSLQGISSHCEGPQAFSESCLGDIASKQSTGI